MGLLGSAFGLGMVVGPFLGGFLAGDEVNHMRPALVAASLSLISIGIGSILGLVITYVVSRTGIDYAGIEFAGVTMRRLLYPVLRIEQFIIFPLGVFITTTLVGIYPAHKRRRCC